MPDPSTSGTELRMRPFRPDDADACLALFDANCPAYFAANERVDFQEFLEQDLQDFLVVEFGAAIAGCFGITTSGDPSKARLNWIMIDPAVQGQGLGAKIMSRAHSLALGLQAKCLDIAASQYSAPFFARYGATESQRTRDGWGPGMDRVDMQLEIPSGKFT